MDSPIRLYTLQKLISTSSTSFADYSPISELSSLKIASDFEIPKFIKPHVAGDFSHLQLFSVTYPNQQPITDEPTLLEISEKLFTGNLDLYSLTSSVGSVPVSLVFKSSTVLNYLHSIDVSANREVYIKASVGSVPELMSASSMMELNKLNSMLPLGQYFTIQLAAAEGIAKFSGNSGERIDFKVNSLSLRGYKISNHLIPQIMIHAKRYSFGRLVGQHTLCTLNLLEEMLK